ncbi:integrase [Microbacterium sp. ZKA21]|uniref:tyrosine-type recombinase/integrase n=1 Tax=Microbacterium sp. ZKA21 TaxID=3381694 RepID=UPI003D203A6C
MADIMRRCGCRDENGKQYGARCPKLKNSRHGTWSYRLSAGFDPKTGRRRYVSKSGFESFEDAKTEKMAAEKKLHTGTYRFEKQKLSDYLTRWLDKLERNGDLKPSTVLGYRRYIEDISDHIGHHQVSALRKGHVAELIDALVAEGRGATAIRRLHATLRSALNDALERDMIDYNPAARVKLPKTDKQTVRPWEPEEAGRFLDVASQHRLGALFELAILTGLRRGELVGLRWEDVDLPNRRLTVTVQVVRVGKKALEGSIKTDAGQNRIVPLNDRAVGALVAWQIKQSAEREEWAELYDDSGRVFTMADGRELRPEYPSRLFEQLQEGMRPQRFHDLRHLFASLALSSGEDMGVVSKIMGHSTSQITRDLYGHLVGDKARTAVAGVASLLPSRGGVHTTVITGHEKAPVSTS